MKNKLFPFLVLALLVTLNFQSSTLFAQGTAFTYQGRLTSGAGAAGGAYDFQFGIHSAASGAAQVGATVSHNAVAVSNGLFAVVLDFGVGAFPGAERWLEIAVRTNGAGVYVNLTPRQKITATPYAITADNLTGTLPGGQLAGTYSSPVTLNNVANNFAGGGANLTALNASQLTSGTVPAAALNNAWRIGGNAGTAPGTHFLGTTDNLALEFKINGVRALRLEPNPNAPNVVGGSAANEVTNGIYGAVIAGGGSTFYPNRVGAIFGTVAGGSGNTASGNFATAMGQFNTASGYAGTAMGYSTVAGGYGSQAGGTAAKANHDGAFVWADNTFADFTSTAANQFLIRAAGGVGINNNNPNGAALAVNGNITVHNNIGTPGNQPLELKVNDQRALRLEPTAFTDTVNVIGGSARNFVGAGVAGATIGGGGAGNYSGFTYTNQVEADFGTVSGGAGNRIMQIYAAFGTIGGGIGNTNNGANAATIGGGYHNSIQPGAYYATIAGGAENTIQNVAQYAAIGGGVDNTIQSNAYYAMIPGGRLNSATDYAFAAGNRAKANHTGAFVWADSTEADFASTDYNQFAIRASGGVRLSDSTPNLSFGTTVRQMLNLWGTQYGIGVQSSTVYFRTDNASGNENGFAWYKGGTHNAAAQNAGGGTTMMKLDGSGLTVNGTFVSASDRNLKENFSQIDAREVLNKVAALPISSWNYKEDKSSPHIGPMAQDFYAAFNVGPDDKHIATVDESGVALAAIQGLNQKLEAGSQRSEVRTRVLEEKLQEKETEITELKQRLDKLERMMNEKNRGAR